MIKEQIKFNPKCLTTDQLSTNNSSIMSPRYEFLLTEAKLYLCWTVQSNKTHIPESISRTFSHGYESYFIQPMVEPNII